MSQTVTLPHWVDNSRIGCGAGADFMFDPFLDLPRELGVQIYTRLGATLSQGRRRRRKHVDDERAERTLACMVANAIVALRRGPRTRVHYSRGKSTYVGSSPYHPVWLSSKVLIQLIDRLGGAGLLITVKAGSWAEDGPIGYRSTYELAAPLAEALTDIGVAAEAVTRDEDAAPVVFLRRKPSLQSYDPADGQVANAIRSLRAWNSQLQEVELGLSLPDGRVIVPRPDFLTKRLYRLFDGSFDLHGRFYGGWWQNLRKELRPFISIGGLPTAEVDYSSLHPRLLYNMASAELVGDAYLVPEIKQAGEADGIAWVNLRPVVKRVFGFLLNVKRRGGYDGEAFGGWPPSLSKAEGVRAIERRHEPIRHHFFKSEGLRLMNLDSRICEAVMSAGVRDGVPVLPIHDSFIVQLDQEEWLRTVMVEAYRAQTGFDPVLS